MARQPQLPSGEEVASGDLISTQRELSSPQPDRGFTQDMREGHPHSLSLMCLQQKVDIHVHFILEGFQGFNSKIKIVNNASVIMKYTDLCLNKQSLMKCFPWRRNKEQTMLKSVVVTGLWYPDEKNHKLITKPFHAGNSIRKARPNVWKIIFPEELDYS